MHRELTDLELANAISNKYPKGKTPVFTSAFDEQSGSLVGVDFEAGPSCVIDETEEDYGLKADSFINSSIPENTKRAYLGDIQYFTQWVTYAVSVKGNWPISEETVIKFIFHHLVEMPPEVEEALVTSGWKRGRGLHSLATVKRRLTSLTIAHKFHDQEDPCDSPRVKKLLSAIQKNAAKQKKSRAITKTILENMLVTCKEDNLLDIRDKALLLFGWASGGRRRSEISDAVISSLEEDTDGNYIYNLGKTKTDQQGHGQVIPINGMAARALRKWLLASGIEEGAVFRSVLKGGRVGGKISCVDINRIVKKRVELAGYDKDLFTAHSLRSGFVTEGGKQGVPLGDIMALTGHKGIRTAMGYYQAGCVTNNRAANLIM